MRPLDDSFLAARRAGGFEHACLGQNIFDKTPIPARLEGSPMSLQDSITRSRQHDAGAYVCIGCGRRITTHPAMICNGCSKGHPAPSRGVRTMRGGRFVPRGMCESARVVDDEPRPAMIHSPTWQQHIELPDSSVEALIDAL